MSDGPYREKTEVSCEEDQVTIEPDSYYVADFGPMKYYLYYDSISTITLKTFGDGTWRLEIYQVGAGMMAGGTKYPFAFEFNKRPPDDAPSGSYAAVALENKRDAEEFLERILAGKEAWLKWKVKYGR